MSKCVLLSYLERNKVIKVPIQKQESDLQYLRKEFIKSFSFEKTVGISFSFQKFDSEWGEFVEIDEDAELADKEKIKVVVIATLGTPGTSTNEEVIYINLPY